LPATVSAPSDGAALEILRKIEAKDRPEIPLHRRPGRRQQLSRDRQVDAGTPPCGCATRPMRSCSAPAGCRRYAYPDNTEIMPQVELRFHFDL